MMRHLMTGTALCSLSMLRAPDDGAGTGTAAPVDGSNGVGAVGNAPRTVADPARPGVDRSDDSFDGLRSRVHALETERDDLADRLGRLESAGTGSSGHPDAGRLDRLESILANPFGRELAEYDATKRGQPVGGTVGG